MTAVAGKVAAKVAPKAPPKTVAPRAEAPKAEAPKAAPRDSATVAREPKDAGKDQSKNVVAGLNDSFGEPKKIPRRGEVSTSPDGRTRTERPDGSTEIVGPDGRRKLTEKDGTVTTEHDGTTRVKHPDGRRDLTQLRDDGSKLERSSYTKDGAKVKEQTITQENGESRSVITVQKGDKTERTVSKTENIEGDIHDEAPEFKNGDVSAHVGSVGAEDGEAGPLQRTRTVRTATENGKTKKLDDSTTLSQEFIADKDETSDQMQERDHQILAGPNGNFNPPGRHLDLSGYDHEDKGKVRLAVTETSMKNGEKVDQRQVGARSEFKARAGDGREITNTENYQLQMENGKRVNETATKEVRGIRADDTANQFDKDEYRDQLGDGPVDYRETVTQNYDKNGVRVPATQRIEVGEIDNPNRPGARTISTDSTYGEHNGSLQKSWTVHKADSDGNGGVRIKEQTSIQGTDAYTVTNGHIKKNGDARLKTDAYDGDKLLVSQVRERERIKAGEVNPRDYTGSPGLAREFLHNTEGEPLAREKVTVTNHTDQGPPSHTSTTVQSGSGDSLQQVDFKGRPQDSSTLLNQPGSDVPFKGKAANGDELQVQSNGKVYRLGRDGVREHVGDVDPAETAKDGLSPLEQSARIVDSLDQAAGGKGGAAGKIGSVTGGLTGALSLVNSQGPADTLGGLSGVTDGLSTISKGASSRLGDGGFSRGLGVTSKILGGASSVLGLAGGAFQIADGDHLGGGLSIAGGLGAAAGTWGTGALVPGIGWTVAGVALTGSLVKMAFEHDKEAAKTHPIEI